MTFNGRKLPYPVLKADGEISTVQKLGFSWGRLK